MKKVLLIVFCLTVISSQKIFSQQKYDDFDGKKRQSFGLIKGMLDSLSPNPKFSSLNYSPRCAKYERSGGGKYGFIKMYPYGKLVNVVSYATQFAGSYKIKMKIYTSAPIGTTVEIQLGSKNDDEYPTGVHSQYHAKTTVRNVWEELTFTFSQIPEGSMVSESEIDKITILFAPNSTNSDTYYFDDLTGPYINTEPFTGVAQPINE